MVELCSLSVSVIPPPTHIKTFKSIMSHSLTHTILDTPTCYTIPFNTTQSVDLTFSIFVKWFKCHIKNRFNSWKWQMQVENESKMLNPKKHRCCPFTMVLDRIKEDYFTKSSTLNQFRQMRFSTSNNFVLSLEWASLYELSWEFKSFLSVFLSLRSAHTFVRCDHSQSICS